MKKLLVAATLALTALIFAACNVQSPISTEPTETTEETTFSETATEQTKAVYTEVKVQVETIKKTNIKKPKITKPKATEKTEPTVTMTMPPTQGVTKPGRKIVVTTVKGSFSPTDLDFIYGSATIKLNDKIEDVFTKLGNDNYEEPTKKKNIYDFDDFEISSYVEDGVERVDKIIVTDEKYSTAKGAKIGMYASWLRRVYGDASKTTDKEYIFGGGTKTLVFSYENNIVTGITYSLDH